MEEYTLIDNSEKNQFEFQIGKLTPKIEYVKSDDGEIYFMHTIVPFGLQGKGIGSQLTKKALANVKQQGLRLIPMCPFTANYIMKHPEWKSLVMKGVSDK